MERVGKCPLILCFWKEFMKHWYLLFFQAFAGIHQWSPSQFELCFMECVNIANPFFRSRFLFWESHFLMAWFLYLLDYSPCSFTVSTRHLHMVSVCFICLVAHGALQPRLCLLALCDGGSHPFILFIFHDEAIFRGDPCCLWEPCVPGGKAFLRKSSAFLPGGHCTPECECRSSPTTQAGGVPFSEGLLFFF